ncbi:SUMF1/EgtB/PvdO family nonheme iron enzyme [Massilia dura]|uniref:SUMF1/EgtB/PvdO family nonheme iron enzyme n=1 Tax=Pseudoduganella dura TaxID=321982 RepID=A0A6I3XG06_9BURK|nr:SUMF1/EgtB/PvdO family nonheme iron enzyme [Pseudoduganella dura]MUI15349.1 SUMF1/EgtB/PvdO family nonheme iron enzyme [Pseudoduganella dura]GGX80569.1 protein kinase [Pseudoduganella dura]
MRVTTRGPALRLAIGAGVPALLVVLFLLARPGTGAEPAGKAAPARLGDEQACAAYGGLPAGWGSDAHAGMVHVDGGSFVFGSERGYPDERPAQPGLTRVKGFWIDRTEVTLAQFAAFVAATGYVTEAERQGAAAVFHVPTAGELASRPYAWWTLQKGAQWRGQPPGNGNLPVTLVTQADALAYARWLGRDLPTEAEWEYAGKAGRSDGQLDTAPADAQGKPGANYWQGAFPQMDAGTDGHAGLAPVGCYAANGFGLHDMIGNVWEWTSDPYTGPRQPHANGDTAVAAGSARAAAAAMVIKGGSFLCSPDYCVRYRASARESQERDLAAAHIGFRTVRRD